MGKCLTKEGPKKMEPLKKREAGLEKDRRVIGYVSEIDSLSTLTGEISITQDYICNLQTRVGRLIRKVEKESSHIS